MDTTIRTQRPETSEREGPMSLAILVQQEVARETLTPLFPKNWASHLFFKLIFFISWRLITSQHFRGFCHTLTWISHGVTCILHPDPHPPTSLSTWFLCIFPVHQARALVSCIPPGLVICFTIDNIYAVLSKHPILTFSHRVQKSVLYICVSFSVLHIGLSLPSF